MRLLALVVVSVLILGCGEQSRSQGNSSGQAPAPVPGEQSKPSAKVLLVMFGADWCHYCHTYLPEIQREVEAMPKATREAIDFRVYVPTGKQSGTMANDKDTLQFAKSLNLTATPYSDKAWAMYRYWISKTNLGLPACAVLEKSGERVIERFQGNDVSFCAARAAKEAVR